MMKRVAFLGLGVMGFPMAGFLQRAGFAVTVYNRTASKAERWAKDYGGCVAASPRLAAEGAELVFACVGNDDDLRAITLGTDGAFQSMAADTVFVDHTTASAELARELYAEARRRDFHFLDAPVSGGQAGAESGNLSVMVGGDQPIFDQLRPVIETFARAVTYLGDSGSGQLCKMVNQICVAGLIEGLAEGIHFGVAAGLDMNRVMAVISKGAAQSWQMENRSATMLAGEYEHGFAVDWMRKDLAMVLAEAEQRGISLPVTAMVDQFYNEVQALGGGRWDTSSLLTRLQAEENS